MTTQARPAVPIWQTRQGLLLLMVGWVAGLSVFVGSSVLQRRLGLAGIEMWFADSYAVLAACDTAEAGLDPNKPMEADPFRRPHVYSDWWLLLGRLGLDRSNNFSIGMAWCIAFCMTASFLLSPRNPKELIWSLVMALSPPVLLGIYRANNDLVIFVLLALAAFFFSRRAIGCQLLAGGIIALAAGLKYYPVAGICACLLVSPSKWRPVVWGWSAAASIMALLEVRSEIERGIFRVNDMLHISGGMLLFRNLGLEGLWCAAACGSILLAGGYAFWRLEWMPALGPVATGNWRRSAFMAGAAVSVACFVANISYSYRLVHLLMLVPFLFERATQTIAATRYVARVTLALLGVALWSDGLVALIANTVMGPMPLSRAFSVIMISRWITQPPIWILMALIIAWMLAILRQPVVRSEGGTFARCKL